MKPRDCEMKKICLPLLLVAALSMSVSCREDTVVFPPEEVPVGPSGSAGGSADVAPVAGLGFYLLNSGNMGSNKCTLDRYSYGDALYTRNIYSQANPEVPMSLGDVGNDLKVYGSRLWAVVNASNKIEVMRVSDARRIGQIDIPNVRYLAFDGPYAYATSYAGPIEIDEDYAQIGYVAKIDTATLRIVDRCLVGFQPDGIVASGGRLYVANSGGYRVPNYEKTLSVINLADFKLEKTVEIGINLSQVAADSWGRIWISSRGDYYETPSRLYCYDPVAGKVIRTIERPVSAMTLSADTIYAVATEWSYETMSNTVAHFMIDTRTGNEVDRPLLNEETASQIRTPYCVAVNPRTRERYVTDAGNYVNPGWVLAVAPDGSLLWRVRTGDVPAAIAFY